MNTTCTTEFDATSLSREVHSILAIVITILVLQLVSKCCTIKCNTKAEDQTQQTQYYTPPQIIIKK